MPGKTWSNQQQSLLIKMYKKNLGYAEMARKHRVTISSIKSKLYNLRSKGIIDKR